MFKEYYIPIVVSFTSKIITLFTIPFLLSYFVSDFEFINIWETWNVWDARHYLAIATENYHRASNDKEVLIGFLPFLPLLMFVFKSILQVNVLTAGYIVSGIASTLLAILLYKLVVLDYPRKTAIYTVLVLFIFPTSFFLHIPFTESLFIMLAVAAFYSVRKKYYWVSFFCIGLATFTKVAGLALIPAIFLEIFFDKENFKKIGLNKKLIMIIGGLGISLSGFLSFLFINYYVWADPFYFTVVQKKFISESFSPFGQGLINALDISSEDVGMRKILLGDMQLIAFFLGVATSIYTLIRVRFSYGIYMVLVLWFSYSLSFWLSMPRHILSLFPMFIVFALLFKNMYFRYIYIFLSVFLLAILASIFVQWGWVM